MKVMLPGEARPGERRWCVATSEFPKPHWGCLWSALAFFRNRDSAVEAFEKLDAREGRAILDLSNPKVRFILPERGQTYYAVTD